MTACDLLACTLTAAAFSAVAYGIRMRDDLGTDEGYLWYGTLRVLAGEIPLRDFRSYEPGRYYWCGLLLRMLGPGLRNLRLAVHLFYFAGLTAAFVALRLGGLGWPAVIAAGTVLVAWSLPAHKLFEHGLLMLAVLAGTGMILGPEPGGFFAAGLAAGVALCFGVNYGLYAGVALTGLLLLAVTKVPGLALPGAVASFAAGAALGVAPFLALLAGARGATAELWARRVRAVLARGSTNLPLAIPWPWRPVPPSYSGLGPVGRRFVQLHFVLLPLVSWGVALWAVFAEWSAIQEHSVTVAAAFVGAVGLHHALSRADLPHLAQSMAPLVLGAFAMLAGYPAGWILLVAFFGWGTAATVLPFHPAVVRRREPAAFAAVPVSGTEIWMAVPRARLLEVARSLAAERLEDGESLLALPTLVWLYPALGLRAPVYDTFCVYPADEHEEERMRRSIRAGRVRLAIIADDALDGREDLRFSRTHPAVWRELLSELEPVRVDALPPSYHVLERVRPFAGESLDR